MWSYTALPGGGNEATTGKAGGRCCWRVVGNATQDHWVLDRQGLPIGGALHCSPVSGGAVVRPLGSTTPHHRAVLRGEKGGGGS